jgi:ribonuclease HII
MTEQKKCLKPFHDENIQYEICLDECARGCLFGRMYASAVVLTKDDTFKHYLMKDSKKIHSRKKMAELSDYIKENAIAYSIQYVEADVIDEINILQANMRAMHECIKEVIPKLNTDISNINIIVDGNYFKQYPIYDDSTETMRYIPYTTIEKGDGIYSSIAAASILAKQAHDLYIENLCIEYTGLITKYGLNKNMGYGTKSHLNGIKEHGITQWHRKTFGEACKNAQLYIMTGNHIIPRNQENIVQEN